MRRVMTAGVVFGAVVGAMAGCSPGTPAGQAPSTGGTERSSPEVVARAGAEAAEVEPEGAAESSAQGVAAADERYVLGVSMNRIDGQPESLEAYKGKVVLVVNVASACGLTPQYEALQALYAQKGEEGLVILGFPANNFGNQEPGSNAEIQEFCSGRFQVSFPMFEKISVVGEDQHPLFSRLSQEGGPPTWNFTKYLVDRQGRVVARFDPRTAPNDPALVARVEELLAQ